MLIVVKSVPHAARKFAVIALCSLAAVFSSMPGHTEEIRYLDNTDTVDRHGVYFIDILKLALQKSTPEFGEYSLVPVPVSMRQERQFKSIEAGLIDLMWTVTSEKREKEARPIRIPLLKGLIGHRVFVINKTRSREFASVTTLEQLAQYTAVQGHDWPDSLIMENAGLKVEKIVWHSSMYKLISSGIVDYFPRSVLEVIDEIKFAEDERLMIEPNHLLVYPSAIYFFVSKDNEKLARRLEMGLNKAIDDGSFDRVFYAFPGHYQALKSIPLAGRKVYRVDNPLIPDATPLADQRLWMRLD